MFATELVLDSASCDYRAVRWQLFCFREVRDVLPASRPGTVVVIHTGAARPDVWRAELDRVGEPDVDRGNEGG